jgi:hypothetical protein
MDNSTTSQAFESEAHDSIVAVEDFSQKSMEELTELLSKLQVTEPFHLISQQLRAIKNRLDQLLEVEEGQALAKFVEQGGEPSDFQYKKSELCLKAEKYLHTLKEQTVQAISQLEKQKAKNLERKKALLEQIRVLLQQDETKESHQLIKQYQTEWKSIGAVPSNEVQELWASYQALMDRYYNQRSLFFELKELDRKKNFDIKKQLVERAEALVAHPSINHAFSEFRKLQEEFRSVGPVPKEEIDLLWQRLRNVFDALIKRREAFFEALDKAKQENLEKKQALIQKLKSLDDFTSEKIDEWKEKNEWVKQLQNEWKEIGHVVDEHAKEVSNAFWSTCKSFFAKKNAFFATLDKMRNDNLVLKTSLCERAEALAHEEEFSKASKQVMQLQKEWKVIGNVPLAHKDKIYQRFKSACDAVFNKQREKVEEEQKVYENNLAKKESMLQVLKNEFAMVQEVSKDKVEALVAEWEAIGFVPMEKKRSIEQAFKQLLDEVIDKVKLDAEEKEKFSLWLELKHGGEKKVEQLLKDLQRKSQHLKEEINTYKNNVAFLANSPKAASLREEVEKKVAEAEHEWKKLTDKIKILKG